MRRIASVFASKRNTDKTNETAANSSPDPACVSYNNGSLPLRDATKKKSGVLNSLSRRAVHPTLPQLIANDHAHSSASSSSGSTTLPTPDDENQDLSRTPSKKTNWKSWLGGRKPTTGLRNDWDFKPEWLPPLPTSDLRPPQIDLSNDTDDASSQSDQYFDHPQLPQPISPAITAQARANIRTMIANSLMPQSALPPLLDYPPNLPFPRSGHKSSRLLRTETVATRMHRALLLKRLNDLTPVDEHSIAPLASRPIVIAKQHPKFSLDEEHRPPVKYISAHSAALNSWVSRPCYEERVLVWTRQENSGDTICTRVTGSALGVAALELSRSIEALAGFETEEDYDPMAEASLDAIQVSAVPIALPAEERKPSLPPISLSPPIEPSPTLIDFSHSEVKKDKLPLAKRGVRFAEVDKEDQIPLGYVLRIKKRREEKARFLLQERERRAQAEEKHRLEAERRKREAERFQREVEVKEREKEWKAREEEKRKLLEEKKHREYTEAVVAARARRDASRGGHVLPSAFHDERERSIRETTRSSPARNNSSPAHNSSSNSLRRPAPELIVTASIPAYDGSPASSLPPTPGSQRSISRPPSVYSAHTASSEDVRARDGRRISKRSSQAVDPKYVQLTPMPNPRASLMPYGPPWGNIPPVPPLPISAMSMSAPPMMPFYPMDMPLLPPSPPFMMNQFGNRPRSYNGSQGNTSQSSPRQSSTGLPRTNSADAVHHSKPKAPTTPYSAYHQRRASDESAVISQSSKHHADTRTGSQTDLRERRSPNARPASNSPRAYTSITASQQYHRVASALMHPQTPPPVHPGRQTSLPYPQLPPTNRRQSVIS
ncbi:hypothetical protein BJ138DRAFT_448814 [Hygrophoropsis aurantiaca]|uniref:Uncharacterized protein n=1 Tax=Hygrophoropsis aurantiaca TaxID=72124 RepID=A0ACB8ALT2_9AGAM|nr:hypothetical protein BJ138DRAFT_448814 [Hygrophoropsis aurantiaca]